MTVEEQVQPAKNELASLGIKDLFYKYVRFLPLFILCIALSLLGAYLYLRYATLVYQSSGTLVVKDDKATTRSNDKLEQILVSEGNVNIQNEIQYLRSRPLMERVVRSLDLNFTYLAKGNIKELNIYTSSPFKIEAFKISDSSQSFSLAVQFLSDNTFTINGETTEFRFGQVFQNRNGVFRMVKTSAAAPGRDYILTWQPTSLVASNLLADLVIAPTQGTGILAISKEATNPQLAADVVNQLMAEYQKAIIEDKNEATLQTRNFIDDRLAVVERELDSINSRMLQFQQANNIVDPQAQSTSYLSMIDESRRATSDQVIRLNNAEMLDQYLRSKRNDPVPPTLGIEDPTLTAMVGAYNAAQVERKALLENAPPGNVAVQQKDLQVELLRNKVLENLTTIRSAYRSAISTIQGQGSAAQAQVKTLPAKMQVLADMKRAQETKLVIYNSLLQKREESAIALASSISNAKVLQGAVVQKNPVKPNRNNTRLLAIVIGIVLPALFIFVLELLNDKVTTRYDIERITSVPLLAEIGHSRDSEALVATQNSRSVVAEQFRILRSNLQYVLNHATKPVILVTSSFSGEGKSFVSTNTGAVMALAGKKTIILEFDIRKPKILSHLKMGKSQGLTNYLLGNVRLEDLPKPVPGTENLFVLACGPVPPNPSELLLDSRIAELFAYLKENFDAVIMDTAPVGMVSDALTLSKFADCTLYIVRQGHTFKKQIGLIDEFYQQGKLPKMSIVLNDIKLRSGYGYYGYGRYGYGKGYTSGYFEDDSASDGPLEKWFGWMDVKKWKKKTKNKRTTA